jgi:hypothetical protein
VSREQFDALGALRDVIRIARAASVGVTGNMPRLDRAEQAYAAVEALVRAARKKQQVTGGGAVCTVSDSLAAHGALNVALDAFEGPR